MLKKSLLFFVLLFGLGFSNVSFAETEEAAAIAIKNQIIENERIAAEKKALILKRNKQIEIIKNSISDSDKKLLEKVVNGEKLSNGEKESVSQFLDTAIKKEEGIGGKEFKVALEENDYKLDENYKKIWQESLKKATTLEDAANAQEKLRKLSTKYIENQDAKKEKIKADTIVRAKEKELAIQQKKIDDLTKKSVKAQEYLNKDKKNEVLKAELTKINTDLTTAVNDREKIESKLKDEVKKQKAAFEKLKGTKIALSNSNESEKVIAANNAVINNAGSKIISTEGLKGENLKKALSNNAAAANTMKKYAEKNEKEARENFNNSNKGIEKQTAIDKARVDLKNATTDEAKKKAEEELSKAIKIKKEAEESDPDVLAAKSVTDEVSDFATEERDKFCDETKGCIDKTSFIINVNDISPGMKVTGKSTTENINYALGTIIQTLMIALGSLSLLIMTVGAGYIVMHSGQDELLSKGKSIFMSGVYALVVALGSYYLVSIVRYILYFSNN